MTGYYGETLPTIFFSARADLQVRFVTTKHQREKHVLWNNLKKILASETKTKTNTGDY